jgi:hypothetical protein
MKRVKLEDFRFSKQISTTSPHWPAVMEWKKRGLLTVTPQTATLAAVELSSDGLEVANRERTQWRG